MTNPTITATPQPRPNPPQSRSEAQQPAKQAAKTAPAPATTPKSEPAPATQQSLITVSAGTERDGRIPVTLVVVPLADLDVTAVYIDFRMGGNEQSAVTGEAKTDAAHPERHAAKAEASASLEATPMGPKKQAQTVGDPVATPITRADDGAKRIARPDEIAGQTSPAKAMSIKRPLISHQIADHQTLIIGQAETYRAEVTAPGVAPDGVGWFVRGRFAADGNRDLRSAWVRIGT